MSDPSMFIVPPITISAANLASTNVADGDYGTWDYTVSYSIGDRVVRYSLIYEAVAASTNVKPNLDDGTYWLFVSAINRFKAFDGVINQQTTNPSSIEYEITLDETIDTVGFFNVQGGGCFVTVKDGGTTVYEDNTLLIGDTEAIFGEITGAYTGKTLILEVSSAGSDDAAVGQIVIGKKEELGVCTAADLGIEDFSRKEVDDFGNITIVERPFRDLVSYDIVFDKLDTYRIRNLLRNNRAKAAIYTASLNNASLGTTTFALFVDFNLQLTAGDLAYGTIEVESLV